MGETSAPLRREGLSIIDRSPMRRMPPPKLDDRPRSRHVRPRVTLFNIPHHEKRMQYSSLRDPWSVAVSFLDHDAASHPEVTCYAVTATGAGTSSWS